MKRYLAMCLLLLLSSDAESKEFLASCGKSTSDIVVERKNEIQWDRERDWRQYQFDKNWELEMERIKAGGQNGINKK